MFRSNERFQFWDFTASHRQLLLRCVIDKANHDSSRSLNIDISLSDVSYVNIPTDFWGIKIDRKASPTNDAVVYSLKCLKTESVFTIIAGYMFVIENDLPPTVSSLDFSRGSPEDNSWRKSDNYKVLVM